MTGDHGRHLLSLAHLLRVPSGEPECTAESAQDSDDFQLNRERRYKVHGEIGCDDDGHRQGPYRGDDVVGPDKPRGALHCCGDLFTRVLQCEWVACVE
jgi:hypothetical protein